MDIAVTKPGPDYVAEVEGGIVLRFSRVKESNEDVTSLVRVSLEGCPGYEDGDIFDGKLILTGPQSKASAIKSCTERVPQSIDWYAVITKSCQLVRRRVAEGEPCVDLRDVAAGLSWNESPHLLEPVLRRRQHAVLFGSKNTGKSMLALAWAMLLTQANEAWGLKPHSQERTMYVDYEDEADETAKRLLGLSRGLDLADVPSIVYKRAEQSLPFIADPLARQIIKEGITGLIIDSAALACGGEPEKADVTAQYFMTLRALPITWSVTIAHQPKDKERQNDPFGSIFWVNMPRNVWRAIGEREQGADRLDVALVHRYTNHGRNEKTFGLTIDLENYDYGRGPITIRRKDPKGIGAARAHLHQDVQVLAALEVMPGVSRTYEDLAKATGLPVQSLYTVLPRLGKRRLVQKDGAAFRLVHADAVEPPDAPPYWAE